MKKLAAVLLLFLLGADIAAKYLSLEYVPSMMPKIFGYPYGGIPVFSFFDVTFSLNTVFNSGSAWGFFQGNPGVLFAIRAVIIAGLIAYLTFFNRGKTASFPLWVVVVGAIGNGIDYIVYGQVVDFFHFCFWGASFPIFNLADSYITLGVLSLFFFSRSAKLQPS